MQQFHFHKQLHPLRRERVPTGLFPAGLAAWLRIADVREQRRHLGGHAVDGAELRLVRPDSVPGTRLAWQLERDAAVLQRVGSGGTLSDAYVDVYGGFAKDLPRWLLAVERSLGALLDHTRRLATGPQRRALMTGALRRLRRSGPEDPEIEATLVRELAIAVAEDRMARRIDAFEEAIELLGTVLEVYDEQRFPRQWAETQTILGCLYLNRLTGNLPDNYETAFSHLQNALRVFAPDTSPVEYAQVQVVLAEAHLSRRTGERRANHELAIACCERGIDGFPAEDFPLERAWALYLLGSAYWRREAGDRAANMERALDYVRRSGEIWRADRFPLQHARAEHGLGLMYSERERGDRAENLERAVAHTREALRVHTRADFPVPHGQGLLNLGRMLCSRVAGDPAANLEEAVSCLLAALDIRTFEDFPNEFANTQVDLAFAYTRRILGDRRENLALAIGCYRQLLRVWTLQYAPHENRDNLLRLAELHAELGDWAAADQAYSSARQAEDLIIALGSGVPGQDAVLRQSRDAAVRHGYVLMRLGPPEAAAVRMEQGRARALTDALVIETADESLVGDQARRAAYQRAREGLRAAQAEMALAPPPGRVDPGRRAAELDRMARFRRAKEEFDGVVAGIRAAGDPADFLQPTCSPETLAGAAAALGPGHALVYLGATPWGGYAIVVRDGTFTAVDLPELTDALVAGLLEQRDGAGRVRGGFALAQTGECLRQLIRDWPGDTVLACARALWEAERAAEGPGGGTLGDALRAVLERPVIRLLAAHRLAGLGPAERRLIAETLAEALLRAELGRAVRALARGAIEPLGSALSALSALSGQDAAGIALVPCGLLGAFPPAVLLASAGPAGVLPNARMLLRSGRSQASRDGVLALGDPHGNLPWAIVEADSLGATARRAGLTAESLVRSHATRGRFLDAVRGAAVVGVSCHGTLDRRDMLSSAIHFAAGERITVGEMLTQEAAGLRLLILSACQTAVLDREGALDEVRTMAGAMLHAGSKAVLASLWAVDDRATCLLITRFAQEWFGRMGSEPPAGALARAQDWLRTTTNAGFRRYEASLSGVPPAQAGAAQAGAAWAGARLAPVRGRADLDPGQRAVRVAVESGAPDARPYADPYYWAGFQLMGW